MVLLAMRSIVQRRRFAAPHHEGSAYFTSEQPPSAIGRNAWSAGMVEMSR
jgi:hypothetical protein